MGMSFGAAAICPTDGGKRGPRQYPPSHLSCFTVARRPCATKSTLPEIKSVGASTCCKLPGGNLRDTPPAGGIFSFTPTPVGRIEAKGRNPTPREKARENRDKVIKNENE